MKRICIIIILTGYSIFAYSQSSPLDSINTILKTSKYDTARAHAYVALTEVLYTSNLDTMLPLCNKALDIVNSNRTKKLNEQERASFDKTEAAAYNNIGFVYMMKADNIKAIGYFKRALKIQLRLKYSAMSSTYINMGICYKREGNVPEALNNYHNALRIVEAQKNYREISKCLSNIGSLYYEQKENKKAIDYLKRAETIQREQKDEIGLAYTLHNLGAAFERELKTSTAVACYDESLALFKKNNDEYGLAMALNSVGLLYMDMDPAGEKAIQYLSECEDLYKKLDDKHGLSFILCDLGTYYLKNHKLDKAEEYGQSGLRISKEIGYPINIKNSAELLCNVYKEKGNYKKAFEMKDLFIQMEDSIYNDNNKRATMQKQYQYEYEKKAITDSLKTSGEKKIVQAQLEKEKTQRSALYAGLALVLVFSGFMYNRVKITQRQKQIIEVKEKETQFQKHLIEAKQTEILDSINYAQRIQRALLASEELLSDNLKEYFVFFQPKDIVSGDFYWASKLNNGTFALVTADSTGHGVPGAIMSMLNISCLEKAVESGNLLQPADILNYSRIKIIDRLKKDGSSEGGKDGMDCSLVCFDFKSNELCYSAANNPVWIIRNTLPSTENGNENKAELIELKPDKMPVGKHDKDSIPFKQHNFSIKKNDIVYTLTDGMPDQFGGPKGKKFMYKQLKELLLSISHLPMNEQKEILHKKLNNWKAGLEQVDDILIIGVKIV